MEYSAVLGFVAVADMVFGVERGGVFPRFSMGTHASYTRGIPNINARLAISLGNLWLTLWACHEPMDSSEYVERHMQDITKQAIDKLSTVTSREFIPLSHSNALDRYGSFATHYDPYTIPATDDADDSIQGTLFGGIEILSVKHVDSSEWGEDESLDRVLSDKYDEYYAEATAVLTERFGSHQLSFSTYDYTSPFEELDKFITGDHTKIKIWKPSGMNDDYYYLVNSMSAGDGDLLFILWAAHITPLDYKPPTKRRLP
ncbi:MAG: hypothetical protein P8179_20115 [Candidatus Thiodiazotropha sp.]